MLVYPQGWRRWAFRAPLHLWRLGAGPLLRRKILILATRGRRTGAPRYTALEYSLVDGVHYLGSGWGMRPDWCRNLEADARATVQSRLGTLAVTARRATSPEEFRQLYRLIRGSSPVWADYLAAHDIEDREEDFVAKRDRLVTWRLEPLADAAAAPPPLRADLAWVPVLALLLLIMAIVVLGGAARAAAAEKPLRRVHDPVILPVSRLPGAARRSSSELVVYRVAGDRLAPVPTQFDPCNAAGEVDVSAPAEFALGENDELIFMAKDTGPRAAPEALPTSALLEIEVEDPADGGRGWAYLVDARGAGPAPVAEPYAHFDPPGQSAASPYYRVDYAVGRNFFTGMRVLPPNGGEGGNLLRQTRMLGEPRFSLLFGDVSLSFTENNSIVRVEGIRNGPVRAVRRVHLSVDLGRFFPELPSGTVYTMHYATSFTTPTRMSIPWLALAALKDFRFENVAEFDPNALPLRYWDGANPDGVSLKPDSHSPIESERDHEWYAVSGDAGSFLQVFLMPDEWRDWGIARGTVLHRSAEEADGARADCCAAGFSLLNMTNLRHAGEYQMRQATVVLPGHYHPGDEAPVLAMFHQPLRVSVRPLR